MEKSKRFHIEVLDQERLIKENDLKSITNPALFSANNVPTPDGLLSNEIFGITKDERSGIFATISLPEYFIQPYLYKVWLKIDRNLRAVVYETKYFVIKDGYLVEDDENGETGIDFLVRNINKIKFKDTKRETLLKVLMECKKELFTKEFIVIPPYYRDVNTTASGRTGVGEINKLYINLMNSIKALSESNKYGLSLAGGIRGKIQDLMLEIYNWFTVGESVIGGEHTGSGIFKKTGLMRRSVLAKTTDNSARLVLSAPNIDCNTTKDLMVDMNYSSIPLSAACVIAAPFMMYNLRQFFMNEFGGRIYYNAIDKDGSVKQYELDEPLINFSDDRFEREMNEYIHGYSNRIKAVEIPVKELNKPLRMRFKGYSITAEQYAAGKREGTPIDRDATWLDIFYQCAVESTEDKMAIITRYPMDTYFNQLYTQMHISSMIETEPMVINGKFYPWYPKIRQEYIGMDTSNKFVDTCSIANPYCVLMGADYDGDQVTVKMANTVEVNEELRKYKDSKAQYITLSGINGRKADKEAIQAMYCLTAALPEDRHRLTKSEDIEFE